MAVRAKEKVDEGVARLVAHSADAITCVSDAIADEARGFSPRGQVVTISNGCDFDDFAGLDYTPGEALPDHPHRQLLRQARPAPVPDRARRVRARRAGALPRRLPLDRPRVGGRTRARRQARADPVRAAPGGPRAAARLGGAPAPDPGRGRARQGRPLGEGLRVPRGRAADPRRRAAGRRRRRPDPRDRRRASSRRRTTSRRLKAALAELHARFANGGLGATEIPEETRYRLSRRARAEELAELVRSLP